MIIVTASVRLALIPIIFTQVLSVSIQGIQCIPCSFHSRCKVHAFTAKTVICMREESFVPDTKYIDDAALLMNKSELQIAKIAIKLSVPVNTSVVTTRREAFVSR